MLKKLSRYRFLLVGLLGWIGVLIFPLLPWALVT